MADREVGVELRRYADVGQVELADVTQGGGRLETRFGQRQRKSCCGPDGGVVHLASRHVDSARHVEGKYRGAVGIGLANKRGGTACRGSA